MYQARKQTSNVPFFSHGRITRPFTLSLPLGATSEKEGHFQSNHKALQGGETGLFRGDTGARPMTNAGWCVRGVRREYRGCTPPSVMNRAP